ncbi:MAG: hypothetical protein ACXVCM_10380 [Ktedonobacteraceae bacterium]
MQQPPKPYPQFQPQQWQPTSQPLPPQQQYQQPPQYQTPMPPEYKPPTKPPTRRSRTWLWLLVAAIFVIAIIMGLISRGQSQQPTPTVSVTQTTQPTQATQTLQPTAQKPTPTPQASIQSQLQSIVQKSGAAYVGDATVTYDGSANYAHVFENFPVTGDNNLDVSRIKQDAFSIQKAIWQAHVSSVDSVQIIFNDATSQQRLATCEVERTSAAKLSWANITSVQAWSDYDTAWLSPSL